MKDIVSARLMAISAGVALTCALIGCDKKANADAELERAASVMQKEERAAAPAPAATATTASSQTAQTAAAAAAPASSAAQEMNQAVAAYKAGNIEDAVTRLQRLRAASAVTPEQRMALNDAMAAVMNDVAAQAAKGDPRAIQALKQYDQMKMQRQ